MAEVKKGTRKTGSRICLWPRRKARQASALQRKQISDHQTPAQHIAALDFILGRGAERARLQTEITQRTHKEKELIEQGQGPTLTRRHPRGHARKRLMQAA